MEAVLLVIAAGGALFNSWQIARLAGRVDALESTMQTVLTLLAGRQLDRPAGRSPRGLTSRSPSTLSAPFPARSARPPTAPPG